ncbi:MAG: efflux RND transporter periplasmic adaptor subunit [Woeseia sp.]|nr:efflux RND transporter periplasmic adaptor subunit [Woeseia sp.]MBT8096778.1 efflux RND transporter periplasmic adaptor subunit [Woeseia sp.]NNE62118.1 efflux RND transporter periplasmic adaptor subunit [Woeseia sp.]NNL54044.1 efflux RND transporter periplasmic adaptor subunit [Woeseia sp.]
MAEPADRLSELKIDRATQTPSGGGWRWAVAFLALIVVAVVAWNLTGGFDSAVEVETETARRPPSAAAANSVLDASGYVTARREATVSSEVTGKVTEVLIEEGMSVEAGQVVARLDDTTQRAQLALGNAQLQSARAAIAEVAAQLRAAELERDRLRLLAERKLTSTSSVDAAEANYDALAARLETARENVTVAQKSVALSQDALDDMTIRAPFGGMVVSKNAQPGEMISPISAGGGFTRTGICTIVDMDSLEIEVDVNEAYIQRVKAGQAVSATLDAYPDWQIPADVIAIVPTADRQKATVRVRIGFRERDERVLRDMGVKVAFLGSEPPPSTAGEQPGVLISGSALQQDADGDFVWRVANNLVERRAVTLGSAADRDRVLILAGLRAGDTIVSAATAPLSAGQEVKIK